MKLLLDTHIMLWWLSDPTVIKKNTYQMITDNHNEIWFSVASIWEISIKQQLGWITVPHHFLDVIQSQRIGTLAIEAHHAITVMSLPTIHQDPFDRILIAQAKCEELILVTRDEHILKYPLQTIKG